MEGYAELTQLAESLRSRFKSFVDDIGEYCPAFRELRAELVEIDALSSVHNESVA